MADKQKSLPEILAMQPDYSTHFPEQSKYYGTIGHRDRKGLAKQELRRAVPKVAKDVLTGLGAAIGGTVFGVPGAVGGAGIGRGFGRIGEYIGAAGEEVLRQKRGRARDKKRSIDGIAIQGLTKGSNRR